MTVLGAQSCTTESELYKPRGKGWFLLFVLSLWPPSSLSQLPVTSFFPRARPVL